VLEKHEKANPLLKRRRMAEEGSLVKKRKRQRAWRAGEAGSCEEQRKEKKAVSGRNN